jgi:adenylosuccinate synthase
MREHSIVVDLGYGDAGKGGIVDWLCHPGARPPVPPGGHPAAGGPVHTVVRFNGGAQAAHNVVTQGGRHHTFAQFGSGTLSGLGTRTFLSRFMLVDPLALVGEAEHLASVGVADPLALVAIDREALLTTPYHQAANRAREAARGAARHGSCGMGIGETAAYALAHPADAPRVGDCQSPRTLTRKLALLCERVSADNAAGSSAASDQLPPAEEVTDAYRAIAERVTITGEGHLERLLRRPGRVVFEGAQGVLLDEWRGFHPYTTWSTTTFDNAEALLAEAGMPGEALRLGVTRAYLTRHGPGPFVTEDPTLELPEPHNQTGRWQGPVRRGHLDAVALRYAIEACGGVDAIALTHLDTVAAHAGQLRVCRAYRVGPQGLTDCLVPGPARDLDYQQRLTGMLLTVRPVYGDPVDPRDWPDVVAQIARVPVAVRSHGPSAASKKAAGFPVSRSLRPARLPADERIAYRAEGSPAH